jgi:uncharacterized protein YbjQ (UPF0145 family)
MTQQWESALPKAARERMAEIRTSETWGSALSTQEFAAIKGAGFDPVGQVLGSAVFHVGYVGNWGCSGPWAFGSTHVSSSAWAPFAEFVKTMYSARRLALARAVAECEALAGDGIVGVKLRVGHFAAGGLEFTALGTAVRARSSIRPAKPFTSHVTGQEFGKLVHAGWIPTGLAFGISVATRHDDWRTRNQIRFAAYNQQVDGYTDLVEFARHDAREQLERDAAAHGGDGVVVDQMELKIRERECPSYEGQRDHIAEALFLGTSIARFDRSPRRAGPKPLAIMTLNRERRR